MTMTLKRPSSNRTCSGRRGSSKIAVNEIVRASARTSGQSLLVVTWCAARMSQQQADSRVLISANGPAHTDLACW